MEGFAPRQPLPTPSHPPSTTYVTPGGVVYSGVQMGHGQHGMDAVAMVAGGERPPTLVEMLNRIDAFDSIPRLQVKDTSTPAHTQGGGRGVQVAPHGGGEVSSPESKGHGFGEGEGASVVEVSSTPAQVSTGIQASSDQLSHNLIVQLPTEVSSEVSIPSSEKKSKVGRPRTRLPKDHQEWHYHLGGMRHSRVPLSPDLREALEVAYVSRIMSKNFRKEGQPEKERIARVTGMDLDKVQEWFKNRRKKDRLHKDRVRGVKPQPKPKRGQSSTSSREVSGTEHSLNSPVTLGMVTMEINPSAISMTTAPTQHIQTGTVPIATETIVPQELPRLQAVKQGSSQQQPGDVRSLIPQFVTTHSAGGAADVTVSTSGGDGHVQHC